MLDNAAVRWEQLFDDLEAQLEAGSRRDLDAEVADRTRRERAGVRLQQRLTACIGSLIDIRTLGDAGVRGILVDLGADWVLVRERSGATDQAERTTLVPLTAVLSVLVDPGPGKPQQRSSGLVPTGPAKRFGLGYALRALSRDRSRVRLTDVSGLTHTGTIDAVGADALDFAEHPGDLPPRPENVTARRIVPFSAVALVGTA